MSSMIAAIVAARDRLLDELAELLLDQLRVLLADRLAEHVGFGERDAGEHLRDAHHLLLIGDDAVGRLEDRLELGQRVRDRLFAALPPDVDLVHAGVERPGTHQRVRGDEVVEAVAAHAAQHVGRERRLELEDAGRASRRAASGTSRDRRAASVSRSGARARARLDRRERVVDDRQRREAEEIHLQHARLLEAVHVVLGHDDGLILGARPRALRRLRADRDVLVDGPGAMTTPAACTPV